MVDMRADLMVSRWAGSKADLMVYQPVASTVDHLVGTKVALKVLILVVEMAGQTDDL